MGVFHKWGSPIAGWVVVEKPIEIWTITRGSPIIGNPQEIPLVLWYVMGMDAMGKPHRSRI